MLSQIKVLNYIKSNLSFPFMALEIDDQNIIDYFIDNSLEEFSRFFPYKSRLSLNLSLATNLVSGSQNQYYLYPEEVNEGCSIMNVSDVTMPNQGAFLGHPLMGVMNYGDLPQFELDIMMSKAAEQKSMWNFNFLFHDPNILEIRPVPSGGSCMCELELTQPPDLRGINSDVQHFFKELALADSMIRIGRIRKRYGDGNLKTPFGDIPLEGESLFSEGKELRREVLEKLEKTNIPNISIDFG